MEVDKLLEIFQNFLMRTIKEVESTVDTVQNLLSSLFY